ncbi:hypothetical protein V1478_001265 [Vespula squamosa]|uniref:Uncharacterized protein n=1 Tax=Vespula squamosa TaxID=30214 RepID=A0ABD2C0Y9_VESSQ
MAFDTGQRLIEKITSTWGSHYTGDVRACATVCSLFVAAESAILNNFVARVVITHRPLVNCSVTYTALFNLALPQKQSLFRTIEWKRYDVSLWSSVKPIYNKKLYSTQDNDWTESPRFRWLSLTMQSGLCTGKYARWIWQYSNRIDIFRSRRRPRKILNSTVWSGFPRNMQDGFSYGRTE